MYASFNGGCCYGGGGSFCESAVFNCDGCCYVGAVFDGGIWFGDTALDGSSCCCGADSSK